MTGQTWTTNQPVDCPDGECDCSTGQLWRCNNCGKKWITAPGTPDEADRG